MIRVRRRILTVAFLAIVVGVVFFPDWERWGGKPDAVLMQAVASGSSGEALRVEVGRRLREDAGFRELIRGWYFAAVESGDVESRGRVWTWGGVIWGDGELAGAIEERIRSVEDGGARGRLLEAYFDGGGDDVEFLVGLLEYEGAGGMAARWLVENGVVPEEGKAKVAGVLAGEADAGAREAMAGFFADGVLGREVYAGWLRAVAERVEAGDGSCCPGGREERARILGELERALADVTSGE